MGLLDGTTHYDYYSGNNHGNYQFTSLEDVITQFQIAYVGEDKIISKIKRTDIAFHAQRGMQELSFDTFKSFKAQEIKLPPSLKMMLPHDYVNYTKISCVDSSGIKHPLYPTSDTSNPFTVSQVSRGSILTDSYEFSQLAEEVIDGDFSSTASLNSWVTPTYNIANGTYNAVTGSSMGAGIVDNSKLTFQHQFSQISGNVNRIHHSINHVYQELDVSDKQFVNLSALGEAVNSTGGKQGILRVGLSTQPPNSNTYINSNIPLNNVSNYTDQYLLQINQPSAINAKTDMWDLTGENNAPSYLEWVLADGSVSKELQQIDVTNVDTVYVIAISYYIVTSGDSEELVLQSTSTIDNISVVNANSYLSLTTPTGNETNSTTWNKYKSLNNHEIDHYSHHHHGHGDNHEMLNKRYGLDPQRANANGSFYIDQRLGKIHFSSNIAGKTVILDYISDSLGTDGEMQVHKFAEEAMYKHIAHAILSTRANTPEYMVQRFKKERFAAIRTAKLRLSNIKLEELTQTLRGKSKQIKH